MSSLDSDLLRELVQGSGDSKTKLESIKALLDNHNEENPRQRRKPSSTIQEPTLKYLIGIAPGTFIRKYSRVDLSHSLVIDDDMDLDDAINSIRSALSQDTFTVRDELCVVYRGDTTETRDRINNLLLDEFGAQDTKSRYCGRIKFATYTPNTSVKVSKAMTDSQAMCSGNYRTLLEPGNTFVDRTITQKLSRVLRTASVQGVFGGNDVTDRNGVHLFQAAYLESLITHTNGLAGAANDTFTQYVDRMYTATPDVAGSVVQYTGEKGLGALISTIIPAFSSTGRLHRRSETGGRVAALYKKRRIPKFVEYAPRG